MSIFKSHTCALVLVSCLLAGPVYHVPEGIVFLVASLLCHHYFWSLISVLTCPASCKQAEILMHLPFLMLTDSLIIQDGCVCEEHHSPHFDAFIKRSSKYPYFTYITSKAGAYLLSKLDFCGHLNIDCPPNENFLII